jgi:hypothetical protein
MSNKFYEKTNFISDKLKSNHEDDQIKNQNFNITTILKDTLNEDKVVDTSTVPLSRNKKPKYLQFNSKIINKRIRNNSPDLNPIRQKKKKIVAFKSNFFHIVEIESYKFYNKTNTWPDIFLPDDLTYEHSCKKCKDWIEKSCKII